MWLSLCCFHPDALYQQIITGRWRAESANWKNSAEGDKKRHNSTGHISTTHRQTQRNKAEAKWKMCCHLVSFSESCLARFFFFNAKPMETSATPDSRDLNIAALFDIKQVETGNPLTYHLHIMLRVLFYQTRLQWTWVTHHFHREHPQHTSELSSPNHHPFTPEEGVYFSSVQYANSPQATRMLLIFTATSLCLFYEGFCQSGTALWV